MPVTTEHPYRISFAKAVGLISTLKKSTTLPSTDKTELVNNAKRKVASEVLDTQHAAKAREDDQERFELPQEFAMAPEMFVYDLVFGGNASVRRAVMDQGFLEFDSKLGYWKTLSDKQIEQKCLETCRRTYKVVGKNKEVRWLGKKALAVESLSHAQTMLNVDSTVEKHWLRTFRNGTVDMRDGSISPHDPEDYITTYVNADYKKGAECPPAMRRYIESSFGIDQMEYVQAAVRLMIDPTMPHKFVHVVGFSGTGKGIFGQIIAEIYGENSTRIDNALSIFGNPDKHHQYLRGAGFWWCDDLVGHVGDEIGAFYTAVEWKALMGRSLFSSTPYVRVFPIRYAIASTGPISSRSSTTGGWSRRVMPLPTQFVKEPDLDLFNDIRMEIGDVVSWALTIEKERARAIIMHPGDYNEAAAQYLEESELNTNSAYNFVAKCLIPVDPESSDTALTQTTIKIGDETPEITNGLLHDLYKAFCAASSYPGMGLNNFVAQLKQCIPSNHVQRRKVNGEVIPAKWVYLQISPGCFTKNEVSGLWQCDKTKLQDVGLSLFKRWAANFGQLHPYSPGTIPNDMGSGSGGTGGTGTENAADFQQNNFEEIQKQFSEGQKSGVPPVPPDPLTTECGLQPSGDNSGQVEGKAMGGSGLDPLPPDESPPIIPIHFGPDDDLDDFGELVE